MRLHLFPSLGSTSTCCATVEVFVARLVCFPWYCPAAFKWAGPVPEVVVNDVVAHRSRNGRPRYRRRYSKLNESALIRVQHGSDARGEALARYRFN